MILTMRLEDYLQRVDVDSNATTSELLRRVHAAHRETFLFENLTIQTGGAISLSIDDLQRKFLDEGRGGYCFEHNTLFAAVLRELGFAPVTLLGRVRRGPPERWCRTHMVLRVPADGETWLADVGFGGAGLLEPIPLRDGAGAVHDGLSYSLRRDGCLWVLSMQDAERSTDLYEFSDDPQTPWDVEVANHFTATHPDSVFRRTLTIQSTTRSERVILRNDCVTRSRNGRWSDTPIVRAQLVPLARELFGIDLSGQTFLFDNTDRSAQAFALP
jgi:N-hydroxyarylamine O-acetyltransferase